jgi:hypothetical protein
MMGRMSDKHGLSAYSLTIISLKTLGFVAEEALPRGVQQYLQIANLDTEPQQRLFDEIV